MLTELPGLTGSLVFSIVAAAFGSSFQFGYSTGVVNAPSDTMKKWLNETNFLVTNGTSLEENQITLRWSFVVSIFCIGGMIGGLFTSFLSTRFGRKGGLLLNNVLAIIGGLLMGLSKLAGRWEMLLVGRLIIGINAGINTGIAPLYLTEISPVHMRGAVGTIHQLVVTISILVSQVLGMHGLLGNAEHWDLLFGLALVPAVFQILTLPFCPESPRYLFLYKDREEHAHRALMVLRRSGDVSDELDEMRAEKEQMAAETNPGIGKMLTTRALRWPLIISIVMMMSQQLSGINAVIYYSTSTFRSAGMTESSAQLATLCMGTINVLMTFVSMVLVDRAGRRTLHMIGLGGMAVDTIVLVFALMLFKAGNEIMSYVATVAVIMFVVMFATGPGSIPWFYVTELFTQGPRSTAMMFAVVSNWTSNFIVGQFFELIQEEIGSYVFFIFTGLLVIFAVFTYFCVPETKGKTIEEIQAEMKQTL